MRTGETESGVSREYGDRTALAVPSLLPMKQKQESAFGVDSGLVGNDRYGIGYVVVSVSVHG